MADWLTGSLRTIADAVQFALDKLEQKQVQRASKRYAQAPVANRWYTAWREQKGLGPEISTPLDDAPTTTQNLTDIELDTLLTSFYGAKSIQQDSPASIAKQRLLTTKANPEAERSGQHSYISRIASVVRNREVETEVANANPDNTPVLTSEYVAAAIRPLDAVKKPVIRTPLPVVPSHYYPEVVATTAPPTKPFASSQSDDLLNTDPNPLAHMVAKNQFLSDRINRLANQYFEDQAAEQDD